MLEIILIMFFPRFLIINKCVWGIVKMSLTIGMVFKKIGKHNVLYIIGNLFWLLIKKDL